MRIFYILLAVVVIFGSTWVYKLFWGKPYPFNLFVERATIQMLLPDPELISNLGIVENSVFDVFSDKLTDISYKKNLENEKTIQNLLTTLHSYERERLRPQEQLTFDILGHYLNSLVDSASFGYGSLDSVSEPFNPYPVNQLFGIQNTLPDFMVNMHRVTNKKSAQNYIARLSQWEIKFNDLIQELKLREQNGVIPPRFVIEQVIEESQGFIQIPAAENMLYTSFNEKLKKTDLSLEEIDQLKKQALQTIQRTVYPAYSQLIAFLQDQKSRATMDDGVWKFPNGDTYYAHCLKYHTTTSDSPEKVHALGLSEVARIQAEMRVVLDQIGYQDLGIKEAMGSLGKNPRFLYPDTTDGRKQILLDFYNIFDQIKDKLPFLFNRFPKAELKIEPVPEYKAKTAPFAYYEPGDLKGIRPGVFYINTYNIESQTKYTMPTLAYHEGLPGHHLQIALAQEIPDLPMFRRAVVFTAYAEGWALYCEQLAWEYKFTTAPEHNLGRLQYELMRAVRLVVDTGIHYKRWTRQQAIQYMVDATGLSESEVGIEIDRYIVLPGQACSYKIGMIKLLELREQMKNRMGTGFDIKKFHDIILENGAMPLSILEEHLNQVLDKMMPSQNSMQSFSAGFEPAA